MRSQSNNTKCSWGLLWSGWGLPSIWTQIENKLQFVVPPVIYVCISVRRQTVSRQNGRVRFLYALMAIQIFFEFAIGYISSLQLILKFFFCFLTIIPLRCNQTTYIGNFVHHILRNRVQCFEVSSNLLAESCLYDINIKIVTFGCNGKPVKLFITDIFLC